MTSAATLRCIAPFLLRAALGGLLIALLLWFYGANRIVSALMRENLTCFTAAVVLYLAGQVMSSYRWQLLARVNRIAGPWREYLAYYFIGVFTNLFVPGLIGGDAARAAYLGLRHGRTPAAIGSVVADRGVGLVALFWFAAFAVLVVRSVALPSALAASTLAIGALSFAGYLAGPILARLVLRSPKFLARLATPMLPYLQKPSSLIPAILLSFILQASLAICQYLLAIGIGLSAPLSVMMLIVPLANVAASLPITLNGLGVRESAYLLLFGLAGVAHQDAIALGLLWFAATMIGGLAGVVPFAITPAPTTRDEAAVELKRRAAL